MAMDISSGTEVLSWGMFYRISIMQLLKTQKGDELLLTSLFPTSESMGIDNS